MATMNPVQQAIQHMGNASRLAEAMGCTVQAVCFWRDGKRKIDAETAMVMERVTNRAVSCEVLCPSADWAYIRNSQAGGIAISAQAPATIDPKAIESIATPVAQTIGVQRRQGGRREKFLMAKGGANV